ncbi:MAG: pyridoxal-dependent decarboxylase [Phycisphaerales bacterium]|jgi:aromatic-L-amino-acid decarboxylase|nr:pyridoxal-dependent decarboxylase [Phycisphaerales bacterium]
MSDREPDPSFDIESFRAHAHAIVDRIADYYASIESRPVRPPAFPGDVLASLPDVPPEHAEDMSRVLHDVDELIVPNLTHWQHPAFFAYFSCNASPPAILGEMLAAGLNVNPMLWATSPAATELEIRVLDWMARAFGLPDAFLSTSSNAGGCIQGTASEATLVALLASRHRALQAGADPTRLCVYASDQAHSSVVKAAMVAGLARSPEDRERVRLIESDRTLAMGTDALSRAMREDAAAGLVPAFVCATVGTTPTGAFDPIAAISSTIEQASREAGLPAPWLHVDGAWAGSAAVCPEHRDFLAGVERADSLCINPHKWLLTNFDCDLFWTRDRAALTGALSITPEYLRTRASDAGAVIDFRDWQVPLGRRFRALKLWMVVRGYGLEGLRSHIRGHVRLAEWLESEITSDERFTLVTPRSLGLVCFALEPAPGDARTRDELTRALMERLNDSGAMLLSHATLPERLAPSGRRYFIRLAIGGTLTRERHVRAAWDAIRDEAERVRTGAA